MPEIILTEEQVQVVASALAPVQVRDSKGNVLGTLAPLWTEEDIAQARRALDENQTWCTTDQVLAHLRSLGEK
jgi:hypothetical protein